MFTFDNQMHFEIKYHKEHIINDSKEHIINDSGLDTYLNSDYWSPGSQFL